jgi:hypothetical protein
VKIRIKSKSCTATKDFVQYRYSQLKIRNNFILRSQNFPKVSSEKKRSIQLSKPQFIKYKRGHDEPRLVKIRIKSLLKDTHSVLKFHIRKTKKDKIFV